LGLVAPREVDTSRSIVINAPPEVVFATVNDVKTNDAWSPWKAQDPTIKTTYGGTTQGEGATYSWTSEKSGSGTFTITGSYPADSILTHVEFDGQGKADAKWTFAANESGTTATWGFHSRFPIPFNIMLLFMDFDAAIGGDYQRGLELLKAYVESQPPATTAGAPKVQETTLPGRHYLMHREVVSFADMGNFFQTHMPRLATDMQNAKIAMAGTPSGLFYKWDEARQESDAAVAIPVAPGTSLKGYSMLEMPGGKALLIDYYGSYEGSAVAHEAMDKYMKEMNLSLKGPVLEEYVTDPVSEPDTAKWHTKVIYFVE
jgi:effector-binding domain-containing protein